ncbi:MAG TPA: WecB/TagA/CpsF family glycosyltransferase [Thermomicrobiales bacterium]|nr:WecB/TagA/CpsF family glycosyltransferase [Thermomicrobiales bacterium]
MTTNVPRQRQSILGAPVDPVNLDDALALIAGWLQPSEPPSLHHVVTVNPEFVIAARRDPAFANVLRAAALATADGVGISLAGRLLGVPIGERVTGVDLVEGLAGLSAGDERCRLFLLGAGPGVAREAAERLRERFPGLRVAGTFSGSSHDAGFAEIDAQLAGSGATVLLVAFGHPTQDLWIARQREALAAHGILISAGVGGSFDYLSGRIPRAPGLVRRLGLEWLYRLVRQPWRWRRQLALPLFVLLVLRERLRTLRPTRTTL